MRLDRFRKMRLIAGKHGFRAVSGAGERGQRNSGDFPPLSCGETSHFANELETIFSGHANVTYHHIQLLLHQDLECFLGAGGSNHNRLTLSKNLLDERPGALLVINDKYFYSGQRDVSAIRG